MKAKKYSIELSEEAEADLEKSYAYYLEESPKLADTFFKSINSIFNDIKRNPLIFPVAYEDIRKYVVKKFPFVIYYQIDKSKIKVIAIFHTSRNPEIWNERF